jgi:ATP-binding cassette subfamily B protein
VDRVLTTGEHPEWLLPLVAGIFGLYGLYALCGTLHGWLAVRVGSQLTTDLRRRLFAHLTGLSVSFYDRTQVGTLMTRVAQDSEELHVFIAQALGGFLVPAVMAAGIVVVLFAMQPVLALYVLAPLPLVGLATCFFWKSVSPRHERYWRTRARINAFLNTCFSGIREVKAFGQERREQLRFGDHNEDLRGARVSVDQVWTIFFPWVILAFQASGLLVWYFGGFQVLGGRITLGTLMAFLGYLAMLHGPLSVLSQVGQWLTRSLTSAQRIFEMLDRRPEVAEPAAPAPLGKVRGEIEFRDVTFGYLPNQAVIRGLSFRIRPGEVVGVVGRSGAGKSTLAGLIARFYHPQRGQVLLDGRDVRTIASAELSAHVGLVMQEPFIFRGTLAENIAYGRPESERDLVLRAAAAGDCHEFVARLPLGYDSQVGERGAGLSGGEKQRVSIARAILHDPEVLILDEATSSLDTEAERVIHESLGRLVEGRTTVIIAHRLVTLRGCDRILVLERGRLVEEGGHEELLARPGGIYRRLVESQERPPRRPRKPRPAPSAVPEPAEARRT